MKEETLVAIAIPVSKGERAELNDWRDTAAEIAVYLRFVTDEFGEMGDEDEFGELLGIAPDEFKRLCITTLDYLGVDFDRFVQLWEAACGGHDLKKMSPQGKEQR
jgi:hypothetical protein